MLNKWGILLINVTQAGIFIGSFLQYWYLTLTNFILHSITAVFHEIKHSLAISSE